MIAGEWSIMTPGHWCIVSALDHYIAAQVRASVDYGIQVPSLGINVTICQDSAGKLVIDATENRRHKLIFVQEALTIAARYFAERAIVIEPFTICIEADPVMFSANKYGLGTSSAVVVAFLKALFAFFGIELLQESLFKLASIAHLKAQAMQGSCFDIAAAVYGTTIAYRSFDRQWLAQQLAPDTSLINLLAQPWPYLSVEHCYVPSCWHLNVGFSGVTSSTCHLIELMCSFEKSNQETFTSITRDINQAVLQLINAMQRGNQEETTSLIACHRKLLIELGARSSINLEIPQLTNLIEKAQSVGAAAKFSGAGGGDCGIALCFDAPMTAAVDHAWQSADIKVLGAHPLYKP